MSRNHMTNVEEPPPAAGRESGAAAETSQEPVQPHPAEAGAPSQGATAKPIVVDLGKQSRDRIRQLKRGQGPLVKELADLVEQTRVELGADLAGKTLLPVVVIYRKKRRRARVISPLGLP